MAGNGIGPIYPAPMNEILFCRPTGIPPEQSIVKPLNTDIDANVTIKGGNSNSAIKIPHRIPIIAPNSIPIVPAANPDSPELISNPVIKVENASTDPTDRSIPPVIITQAIPIAIIPFVVV